nr:hypothetical protein [Tanacetum cinerariifolium]
GYGQRQNRNQSTWDFNQGYASGSSGRVYATTRGQAAKTSESPNIENLFVVHEFADVFPDELHGLPLAREIEFGIELILVLNLSQRLRIVWHL